MVYKKWQQFRGKDTPSTSGYSEKIFKYLEPNKKVLDLGCGFGRLAGIFKSYGCETYGIDVNAEAIKEAQSNVDSEGIDFSAQDATKTNFDNNFFDIVVSQAVSACMSKTDRTKTLKEIKRILKKDGILQIAEFSIKPDDKERYVKDSKITKEYGTVIVRNDDGSERFRSHNFQKKELEELLTKEFSIISYENPDFITVKGKKHPGHIFICKK